MHVAQVGGEAVLHLRRADTDEVDVGELGHLGDVGGEAQPARLDLLGEKLGQAGLEERHLAGAQQLDLGLVDVVADDLEAQFGHAGGVGGAEISGADDAESQSHRGPFRCGASGLAVPHRC